MLPLFHFRSGCRLLSPSSSLCRQCAAVGMQTRTSLAQHGQYGSASQASLSRFSPAFGHDWNTREPLVFSFSLDSHTTRRTAQCRLSRFLVSQQRAGQFSSSASLFRVKESMRRTVSA